MREGAIARQELLVLGTEVGTAIARLKYLLGNDVASNMDAKVILN